jgi:uncharacterized membrane protein
MNQIEFRTGVIRPLECFKEGWDLIKPNYWLIFAITLVGMLIAGAIPFAVAMGAMYCGIYYCVFQLMQGRKPEFGDLFKGFNYFIPALIATLILIVPVVIFTIISTASVFGVMFSMTDSRGNLDPSAIFAMYGVLIGEGVVFGIISGCIHAFIMFTYPLIVEHNLSGPDAFKLSAKAAWANLGGVVGLIVWEFILGFIGYLVCGIGLYFVLPVLFAGVLVGYRRVFPTAPGFQV